MTCIWSKRFNDLAVGNDTVVTLLDYAVKFSTHCCQVREFSVDIDQLRPRDRIDRRARRADVIGKCEQLTHRVNRKSEAAATTDERQALPIRITILASTGCASTGLP